VKEEGVVTQNGRKPDLERGCYTTKSSLLAHSSPSSRFNSFVDIVINIRVVATNRQGTTPVKMARTRGVNSGGPSTESSLDAAMRAPSTQQPDVVVLDSVDQEPKVKDTTDPKKDLWLSTSDG
jgi:hypothetical protein